MTAPDLIACPLCSHPPHLICRPICVRGVRSGRWMIVTDSICHHFDLWRGGHISDTPEPRNPLDCLGQTEAANRSAKQGHTADQAAKFLAALQPVRYARYA